VGGGVVAHESLRQRAWLTYAKDKHGLMVALPDRYLAGGQLAPGIYRAGYDRVEYVPLTITADSPEELTFKLPTPVTYHGRVVDGVTGEPMAGAFVLAMTSLAHNNLALLDAAAWNALRQLPRHPGPGDAALRLLEPYYGFDGLVRTDELGRFEWTQRPGSDVYGLIAFEENFLPAQQRLHLLKPDDKRRADAGDIRLYPAAKVVIRPVFPPAQNGRNLSVMPTWVFDDDDDDAFWQPEWFAAFRENQNGQDKEYAYVHWLKLNQPQPVFVPAGVKLGIRFDTPYDDQWTPAAVAAEIELEQGQTEDLGDLSILSTLPAAVRVVDGRGEPVEGVPVRKRQSAGDGWEVAHNTDADGVAHFFVHPNSEGVFGVVAIEGFRPEKGAANLSVAFKAGDKPPDGEPYAIELTDEQMEKLFPKNLPAAPKGETP
jgi:hypothetical protein